MKPFVILIGGHNSGKSTIVASLTGCTTRSYQGTIIDGSTRREIYVVASSPQEAGLSQTELDNILDTVRRRRNIVGLVMAIQPTYPHTRLSLEDIIRSAQIRSAFSIFTFLLDPPFQNGEAVDMEDVRERLGNLNVAPHYLDARRFPHLNAADIRTIVGIP